jgi:hypothetical protein
MIKNCRGRRAAVVAAVALAVLVAGCSEPAVSGSNQPGVQGPSSAAPGPAGASQRVTVAESSIPDLAAALSANGVSDPENWAKIIKAGEPYPPGDPGQQKLRQVLAQFKADPDTTAKITNALVP